MKGPFIVFRDLWNKFSSLLRDVWYPQGTLSSEDHESVVLGAARKVVETSKTLIDCVQQEKNDLRNRIDALTRQIAELDLKEEAARARAERMHNLAATIKQHLDDRSEG